MAWVEKEGQAYVSARNRLTGRQDYMGEKVKKAFADFIDVLSLEKFQERVAVFQQVLDACAQHGREKYLYFSLQSFDLQLFLLHLNKFGNGLEAAFAQLALDTERKKLMGRLRAILHPHAPKIAAVAPDFMTAPQVSLPVSKDKLLALKAKVMGGSSA